MVRAKYHMYVSSAAILGLNDLGTVTESSGCYYVHQNDENYFVQIDQYVVHHVIIEF